MPRHRAVRGGEDGKRRGRSLQGPSLRWAMLLVEVILWVVAVVLLVPCTVLFIECMASLLPRRRVRENEQAAADRGRVAVLVPAHDEAAGIDATVRMIVPQLREGDRLLVIADNCHDATATVARNAGAQVTERHDSERGGKGYALAHGVKMLAADPPDVVVVVDADMSLAEGSVDALARQVKATGRAAQAVDLLDVPDHPQPRDLVASLAFTMKNLVRPRGLARLGLPCQLMGTGMALPWSAVRDAKLATGNIVEDLQLGLDLAMSGHAARLCETARVTGRLPGQARAAKTQHARWEQGHLQTIATQTPRLVLSAVRTRRFEPLVLALDLCVPPLSLLVMALGGVLAVSAAAALAGAAGPAGLLLAANALVVTAVAVGCCGAGRARQTWTALLAAPVYLVWKVPLYLGILLQPQRRWHRTEREG